MKPTKTERLGDVLPSHEAELTGQAIDRRAVMRLLCAVAVLGGCSMLFPARYRYRMTVEVDTPQGLRSGSSVREISSGLQTVPGRGSMPMTKFKGEAVAIDLPNGRTLFALLDESINMTSIFEPDDRTAELFVANVAKLARRDQRGRTVVLPPDQYPRLVTFGDINDPISVQAVDPANLAASFGAGMRLKRFTVEITDDPVTDGVEKRLRWLPGLHGSYLDGASIGSAQNNGMHAGYFSTELFR